MRIHYFAGLGMTAMFLALPLIATAKDKIPPPPPQAWQELLKCKGLAEPVERLACYDAATGRLEVATKEGEVVITDRATVRETRKGLFGFKLPSLGLFGGGDEDNEEDIKSVDGTIATARQYGYGRWRVTLADGSVWEQSEAEGPFQDPASGDQVHISKGAMGSYWMKIAGGRAIRVRRVQ